MSKLAARSFAVFADWKSLAASRRKPPDVMAVLT